MRRSRPASTDRRRFPCPYCGTLLASPKQALLSHIRQSPRCKAEFTRRTSQSIQSLPADVPSHSATSGLGDPVFEHGISDDQYGKTANDDTPAVEEPSSKRARVEEVEDEGDVYEAGGLPTKPYVDYTARCQVKKKGRGPTLFEKIQAEQASKSSLWEPFADQQEWGLAHWFVTEEISELAVDKYLKLPVTKERTKPSFKDKRNYRQKIEQLPMGPGWKCETFDITGDVHNIRTGRRSVETVELWKRDPVECIKELFSNPRFEQHIRYAHEPLFEDLQGTKPILSEMWTGEWWEKIQNQIPTGAVVAPVILSSDKTQLSTFSGDKTAWPVYLSVGNISKDIRRSPSSHAMVLIGYLPVTKLECWSKSKRARAKSQLFHECMRSLLRPLAKAGLEGVDMVCADGFIRTIHPILAAYIADHPEQCLVTCVKENHCPKCHVRPEDRGAGSIGKNARWRNHTAAANILKAAASGNVPVDFKTTGHHPIHPFWADLPYTDIFTCITPDILHQLHKGMFKDHLAKWTTACIPGKEDEVDARYKHMPAHPELRYFSNGISLVSQWSGTEYKNMEKVFLGAIAGAVPRQVCLAVRGLLDFIYYAHFESHTNTSLSMMDAAWSQFHQYKSSFSTCYISSGGQPMPLNWANFNGIPKLHAMDHYIQSIRLLGTAGGYSTEGTERLHIDFVKHGYRAGNRKEYISQMASWLNRQEAVRRFQAYVEWRHPTTPSTVLRGLERRLFELKGSTKTSETSKKSYQTQDEIGPLEELADDQVDVDVPVKGAAAYQIAKYPSYPSSPAYAVAARFGAADLSWYLEEYLQKVASTSPDVARRLPPTSTLSAQTRISAYKQFKLDLPVINQASRYVVQDTIRATPRRSKVRGDIEFSSKPGHFSTVFVHTPRAQAGSSTNTPDPMRKPARPSLKDLTVGQVRVIFRAPAEWSPLAPHPLAYVEWFTPLNVYDDTLGMYSVTHSMSRRHRQSRSASIVPITDIVRTCYLIPQWGPQLDRTWYRDEIYEKCKKFYVNPYLRHSDFVLLRFLDTK